MKSIVSLALAMLFAGILGGCEASYSDAQYAQGYVPAEHGYYSHKVYHSRADYYRHYNGIDGG
jgi:hypothetical protein